MRETKDPENNRFGKSNIPEILGICIVQERLGDGSSTHDTRQPVLERDNITSLTPFTNQVGNNSFEL